MQDESCIYNGDEQTPGKERMRTPVCPNERLLARRILNFFLHTVLDERSS